MELPGGGEATPKEKWRWGGDSLVVATDMEKYKPQLCEQLQRVLVDILQRLLANRKYRRFLKQKTLKSIK